MTLKSRLLVVVATVAAVLGGTTALADEGELVLERTFEVGSRSNLAFDSDRGGVIIVGEDRDDIHLKVLARDMDPEDARKALEMEFDERSDGVKVRARLQEGGWLDSLFGDDGTVFYDVRVPRSTNLEIDNGSGGVNIREIDGRVSVDNGSGGIRVSEIAGTIDIDNGSGGIRIEMVDGDVKVDNGSGGVRIEDVRGDVDVDNSSGGVNIRTVEGGVSIDNGSGGVKLDGIDGALNAKTSSGGIVARMAGRNAGIQAETGSGGVRIEVPASWGATVQMSSRKGDVIVRGWPNISVEQAQSFQGEIGGGGPRISLHSSSGDVQLIAN